MPVSAEGLGLVKLDDLAVDLDADGGLDLRLVALLLSLELDDVLLGDDLDLLKLILMVIVVLLLLLLLLFDFVKFRE